MKPISAFAKLHGYYHIVPFGTPMGNLELVGAVMINGQVFDLYPPTPEVEHLPKIYVDGYAHRERAITVENIHPYLDWERFKDKVSVDTKVLFAFIPNTWEWNATFLPKDDDEADRIVKWAQEMGRNISVGSASITYTHTPTHTHTPAPVGIYPPLRLP